MTLQLLNANGQVVVEEKARRRGPKAIEKAAERLAELNTQLYERHRRNYRARILSNRGRILWESLFVTLLD